MCRRKSLHRQHLETLCQWLHVFLYPAQLRWGNYNRWNPGAEQLVFRANTIFETRPAQEIGGNVAANLDQRQSTEAFAGYCRAETDEERWHTSRERRRWAGQDHHACVWRWGQRLRALLGCGKVCWVHDY